MAEPLTSFQQPGFVSTVREAPDNFLLPGSVRTVGLIGDGKATKSVLQEQLTRLADSIDIEALANNIASITRVFSDAVFQYPASSYGSSMTGTTAEAFADVDTLTLKIKLNGAEQTVTFSGVTTSIADVVTQVNAQTTDMDAVDKSGSLKLLSGSITVGDGGAKIEITDGTANSILGFTDNQLAKDLDWTASISSSDANIRPQEDDVYFVDYERPKVAADFKPQFFFSLSQMSAEYGSPSVANSLSLAGQLAFANGASIIVARQLDPEASVLTAEMDAALLDLEPIDLYVIVPLKTDTTLWARYQTHASKMSSKLERKERRFILGVDETSGRLPILGGGTTYAAIMATFNVPASSGLQPKRIEVMNPGRMLVTTQNAQLEVDGTIAAAALAGLKANPAFDSADSMTFKTLTGIDELLLPELLRSEKNTLTSLGVTVLENRGATILIRRSVSADGSSVFTQEPSVTSSVDDVASQMRISMENRFTGIKIADPKSVQADLKTAAEGFLRRFREDTIISNFANVQVERNTVEPRQFDISWDLLPVLPLLWGTLDITITI